MLTNVKQGDILNFVADVNKETTAFDKKQKNNLKKLLTKQNGCDIMNKLSREKTTTEKYVSHISDDLAKSP